MALRTFLRLLVLALATVPLSLLLWDVTGPIPALVGLGLVGSSLLYLAPLAGGSDLSRWQLRYQLDGQSDLKRLEQVLLFLADRSGQLTLDASSTGLYLELPSALDRYVEGQFPRALPELKLSREEGDPDYPCSGSFFLGIGAPSSEPLRWATEAEGRQMRLHIYQGPYVTLVARTEKEVPPGRWLRLPRFSRTLWRRLPLWDELSEGVQLSTLFPPTVEGAVYSSRSGLLQLAPPDDYARDPRGRILGRSTDGRLITLSRAVPLFSVGAPPSFLVRQALDDLQAGRTVVVVSPHRRILERIGQQAGDAPTHWLDPQDTRRSAHLAIACAEEWATVEAETIVQGMQTFLADLGLDVDLPAVDDFTHQFLQVLVEFTRERGHELTFSYLYAASLSTQALREFLTGNPAETAVDLLAQLDEDAGYVQAVTLLSAIRSALQPLATGSLHRLCQPPFLNLSRVLDQNALLLVPMTNTDFPEHDRLLSAMLDFTLRRLLVAGDDVRLALHLHDPHLYRTERGQRWIDAARQNTRISLLSDVQDPDAYSQSQDGPHESQVFFRCSEALASSLVAEWGLPGCASELAELSAGTAIARLRGTVVALKVSEP